MCIYAFLITMYGQQYVIDTNLSTPAGVYQSAIVLQEQLKMSKGGDVNTTVTVVRCR